MRRIAGWIAGAARRVASDVLFAARVVATLVSLPGLWVRGYLLGRRTAHLTDEEAQRVLDEYLRHLDAKEEKRK